MAAMPVAAILFFKKRTKNIPRQAFIMMNISCNFENSTYNTLASRGIMVKSLHTAVEATAYSCVIHSIHWVLSSGYTKKKEFARNNTITWNILYLKINYFPNNSDFFL